MPFKALPFPPSNQPAHDYAEVTFTVTLAGTKALRAVTV